MEQIDSLTHFFSFHNMKRKYIEKLIKHSTLLLIEDGECLFEQSTSTYEMFCLISGQLRIKISSSTTKEDNISSKLVNEYNLLQDPPVILSENRVQLNNQHRASKKERRSSLLYYEIFHKNKLKRSNHCSPRFSLIQSTLHNSIKPILHSLPDQNEIDALTIEHSAFICNWNLLHNFPHYSSAYSKGQCLLLCLDKSHFFKSIEKPLRYSLKDKKEFILSRIKTMRGLSISQFDVLYHQFIWEYPKYNKVIINHKEPLKHFYLIYNGQCSIQPYDYNKKVLHLSAGDFIGLEVYMKNESNNYQCIITSSSYNTILIRFNIELFNPLLTADLREELMPYYYKKQKILSTIINNINRSNQKIKLMYKHITQPIMITSQLNNNKRLHNDISLRDTIDLSKILFKTKLKGNKLLLKTDIKEFSLQKQSIDNTLLFNQFNCTTNFNTISNVTTEPLSERTTITRNTKANNNRRHGKLIKSVKNKLELLIQTKTPLTNMKEIRTPIKTNRPYNSTRVSPLKSSIKITSNPKSKLRSISLLKKTNNEKYSVLNLKFCQTIVKHKKPMPKTLFEKLHETISDWNQTLNNPQKTFITHSFKMPLFSLINPDI